MQWQFALILVMQALLASMTAASFVPVPDGALRICDVPRAQIAIAAVVLAVLPLVFDIASPGWMILAAVAGFAIAAVQLRFIVPYTPFWPKESRWADGVSSDNTISVLVSNVLQTNTHYDKLARLIDDEQPDIVLVMEVDAAWLDGIADATNRYPWRMEVPLDNTYGMALYSKLEFSDVQTKYILREDIPSISAICTLRSGRRVRFIAIHPEPPMPHEMTKERDAEIIVAGQMALDDDLPAIVTGDLNDVAWSRTTLRFRRLSGLLDPRIGRGMYNTFHAQWPIFRWPLDHLFHDGRFALVSMRCLPSIGSDHFPIFFELALNPEVVTSNAIPDPSEEDIEEAEELLHEAGLRPAETLAPVKAFIDDR